MGFNVFAIGIYVAYELKYMPEYESISLPMVVTVCALSGILLIMSLLGCIGALTEKRCLIGFVSIFEKIIATVNYKVTMLFYFQFSVITHLLAMAEIGLYLTIILVVNEVNCVFIPIFLR